MTSRPGLQTIAIHILPNISQSKVNQAIKFGQLKEYNKINIFFSKIMRKMRQGFFKKAYYEVKTNGLQLIFNPIAFNLPCNKNKIYKILDH